jgi:hypothetical protein
MAKALKLGEWSDLMTAKREHLLERLKEIDAELDRHDHWGAYIGALYEERKYVVSELKHYFGIDTSNHPRSPRPS